MAAAPDAPGPLFRLCCRLLQRQDPAANALLPRLHQFPNYEQGWLDLGHALLPQQAAGALAAFSRAHAAVPSLASSLGQAAALSLLDRHPEAAALCAAAQVLAPEDARPLAQLGRVLRRAGDLPGARSAFAQAVAHGPASAPAWFSLGVACQDLRDHAGAIEAFSHALSLKPEWHEAAFNLGVAHQEAGDLDTALDAYAAALSLCPACFGRIAQALASPQVGRLWLHPDALRAELAGRA